MMLLLPAPPIAASQWALHAVPALLPVAKTWPSSSRTFRSPVAVSQVAALIESDRVIHLNVPQAPNTPNTSPEWLQRLQARATRLSRLAARGISIAQQLQACLWNAPNNAD
ncbi:hypothetical protein TRIATDRAFT_90873 [Trichoderma atroviride IMI 206040]|uniref:Uncharacterized protein n=1 Tax=Hypocrea atroviridis (strain ATCC 20476 / IMI 206040) TaxID=452589 RepID=G9NPU4_HYPAI|nr:uncharacterized protein TRIATDRAFT_90873 [Trichoderma atroviride IMI 206040]EHK47097.1 hypothetical protein TRIATDRAFT_90873 [Trichoderma atroviride IMI 206040]